VGASVMPGTTAQFDGGRQLAARIEGGADHPGCSFLGAQWPPNLGSLSWRWLSWLKVASGEKAGIFAFAFQSVAMGQNLPFADLAVLPAGVFCAGHEAAIRLMAMPVRAERRGHLGGTRAVGLGGFGIGAERFVRPEMAKPPLEA
jgi:hypothetical protein